LTEAPLRILIDLNHPAHAHLFRYVFFGLQARGHECQVTARDKDVTLRLLDAWGIPHRVLVPLGRNLVSRGVELVHRELCFLGLARRFRPHLIMGTSAHAARVGRLVGARSAVLNEDDAAAVPLFRWVAYPLATAIVTPDGLAHEGHGRRHLCYPSYQELFYLHPNRFLPDPAVRRELRVGPGDRYAIVRLSALQAHHDIGARGIGELLLRAAIRLAEERGIRVFVSGEKPLSAALEPLRIQVPPERMHDAVAFAEFFLGDSQTMTAEAAVLGVPAFRLSDFVGRLTYLEELERYGLAFGFRPGQEDALLVALEAVLDLRDRAAELQSRRSRMLADKIDPLPWLLETAETLAKGRVPASAAVPRGPR
jgi:predicted glycosyltransferase